MPSSSVWHYPNVAYCAGWFLHSQSRAESGHKNLSMIERYSFKYDELMSSAMEKVAERYRAKTL